MKLAGDKSIGVEIWLNEPKTKNNLQVLIAPRRGSVGVDLWYMDNAVKFLDFCKQLERTKDVSELTRGDAAVLASINKDSQMFFDGVIFAERGAEIQWAGTSDSSIKKKNYRKRI